MSEKPKILLVEDNETIGKAQKKSLEIAGGEIFWAKNLQEARSFLKEKIGEIQLIILDACLESDTPNSYVLISESRKMGFQGPIVASSSLKEYNNLLIQAGANFGSDKRGVITLVCQILNLKNP